MNNSPSCAADSQDHQILPQNIKSLEELDLRDIVRFLWSTRSRILIGIIVGACAFGLLTLSSRQSAYVTKFLLTIDSEGVSATESREKIEVLNEMLKKPRVVKDFFDAIFPIEDEKSSVEESLSPKEMALVEQTRDTITALVLASDSNRRTLEDSGVSISLEAAQGLNSYVLFVKLPFSQSIDTMQARVVPALNSVIDKSNKDDTNAYHYSIRERIPDVQGLVDDIRSSSRNQRKQLIMDSLSIRSEIGKIEYELFNVGIHTEGFRKYLRFSEIANSEKKTSATKQTEVETPPPNLLIGEAVASRIESLLQLKTILLAEKAIAPNEALAIHDRLAQAILRQQELNMKLKAFADMDQMVSKQLNDSVSLRSINRLKLLPSFKLDPYYDSIPGKKSFGTNPLLAEIQVHNRSVYRGAILGGLTGAFLALLVASLGSFETLSVLRILLQRRPVETEGMNYSKSELKESTP